VRHPIYGYQILLMLASLAVLPTVPMLVVAAVHLALMLSKSRNEEAYLHDVHGLDGAARGQVLMAMTVAQIVGVLICGPLDARFNTRRRVVLTGGCLTLATLAALALWPRPPLAVAVTLLVALCAVSSYGVTIVAHGRSLFPDRLLGRGMTTLNLAQVVGASAMPVATGAVAAALAAGTPGDAYPEIAYQAIFALIGACLAAGLYVYSRGADARPRPPAAP
jgi:MFS family permease